MSVSDIIVPFVFGNLNPDHAVSIGLTAFCRSYMDQGHKTSQCRQVFRMEK